MKKILFSLLLLGTLNLQIPILQASAEQTTKQIKLYVYPGCPYCKKVIQFLKKNGWANNVIIVNANEPKNFAALQRLSKNTQCPFLYDEIHGTHMLESKNIMEYFQKIFTV